MTSFSLRDFYRRHAKRILAGLALLAALVMIFLGNGLFDEMLTGLAFFVWWGIVLLLVLIALAMAMLDLMELRAQLRAGKRELFKKYVLDEKLLGDIKAKMDKTRADRKQKDGSPKAED